MDEGDVARMLARDHESEARVGEFEEGPGIVLVEHLARDPLRDPFRRRPHVREGDGEGGDEGGRRRGGGRGRLRRKPAFYGGSRTAPAVNGGLTKHYSCSTPPA